MEINMAKDTHVTAPTRFVEAGAIRYAHRRFGSESGTPLVFLQHFRGGLDNWDPLVTDASPARAGKRRTPSTRWAITSLHSSMPWDYLRSMCSASPSEPTLRRVSFFATPIS